jgi:hypothetical protein
MNDSDLSSSFKAGPKPVYAGLQRRGMTPREALAGSSRLVPVIVVFGTVVGFMALAWYAYQAGSQSVTEDELLVVEADKGPMKEKPTDPGGMQFPNQDKTIFETFSGSSQKPLKVERVLPTPEEPLSKNLDTSETKTWINEKLHQHDGEPKTEQVIGDDSADKAAADTKEEEKKTELAVDSVPVLAVEASGDAQKAGKAKVIHIPQEELDAAKKAEEDRIKAEKEATEAKVKAEADKVAAEAKAKADAEAKIKAEAEKAEADKVAADKAAAEARAKAEEDAKAKAEKSGDVKEPVASAAPQAGEYNAQLGAYSSQAEAEAAWAKMQKKYKQLGNMKPVIIRADLGDKGVFYRLRTGGFNTAGEAKAFCNSMSILGQACLVPSK